MFVHPTQAIEIFGDVSTPFGTLAILYMLQRGLAAIADLLVLCGPTFSTDSGLSVGVIVIIRKVSK